MKITGNENEMVIIKELGVRVKQYRISLKLTQAELAEKCGISPSTVVRAENGDDAKLSNYIKILTGLGLSQNVDILIPEPQQDFKAIFEQKPPRQRVKSNSNSKKSDWVWGEDK